MRVLILGATGMIGSTFFRILHASPRYETWGTLRKSSWGSQDMHERHIILPDVLDLSTLSHVLQHIKPHVVINATGIVKQLASAHDPRLVLPINAIFPHQLASLCALSGARMIQLSTDCVFSGKKGNYTEQDATDAEDLYGQSKAMGEVTKEPHVVTIRTSTIGHEQGTHHGLLEWFLSTKGQIHGFDRAVFSGIPTGLLAHIVMDYVLPNPQLCGLYHVASSPINKFDLLQLIQNVYQHPVKIEKNSSFVVDRSLNGLRFMEATGYTPLPWNEQIEWMYQDNSTSFMESSYVRK